MILAEAREEVDDSDEYIDTDEDEYDSYDSDEALDDVPSLEGGFSNFSDEETKSKFTQYSMSSSVIRRNEQLSTLDDQFEKFFVDQYDENDMGSLEMDEIGGCQTEDSFVMKQNLKKYETEKGLERQMHPVLDDDTRKNIKIAEEYQTPSNNIDIVEVDEEN